MKKILLLGASFALLSAGINSYNVNLDGLKKLSASQITKIFADKLAKNLPMQIDSITKITKVVSLDNKITIFKHIDMKDEKMQQAFKNKTQELKKAMFGLDSKIICLNPETNYMVTKKGIVLIYAYSDYEHKPLFRYSIEKEDCLKFKH